MTTDDFLLDQVERDQEEQTHRRRRHQSRRRRVYVLATLSISALLLLGTPSLLSHSSVGRSLLMQTLARFGLDSSVDSMRLGWITPLQVQGLQLHGATGSEVTIDYLSADVTLLDLIRSRTSELGEVSVRGVDVRCAVDDGRCNLEDDLQVLLAPSDSPSSISAQIQLQDIAVSVTDLVSGGKWQLSQSSAEAIVSPQKAEATFAGVLTEPGGGGGSLQGAVFYSSHRASGNPASHANDASPWCRLEIVCESLPLSAASLVRRRVTQLAPYVPKTIHGDATGGLLVQMFDNATVDVSLDNLRIRNLTAADEGSRVWSNGLATLSGSLVLREQRVIGRKLQAATDFASATVDGAFSRTFSLVGANDNPLCWLDAIDGTATAELDLAAFDRSLPGVLPLREDAVILSGRVVATVDSTPTGETRRSQLKIETDAVHARSRGQAVAIDPMKLSASVLNDHGRLQAEHFEWKSAFGSAVGHGDMRSGVADFDVDFGRLTAMLRPILQVSETTLAGAAKGNVRWNASADSAWKLSGSADANNLLVTFPSGQTLRRASLRGSVQAEGRWGGQALEELSSVNVSLVSNGLDLKADLIQPVRQPSAAVGFPVQLGGTGRLETLAETLGPWLPRDLSGLSGGFQFNAVSDIARNHFRLRSSKLDLNEPSLHYAGRHYAQSTIEAEFQGNYLWPNHDLEANDLTVSGNAFSMRLAGKANRKTIDLDIRWRALLDRLQGSVRRPIALPTTQSPIRQVGYRSESAGAGDQWSLRGQCEGSLLLKRRQGVVDCELDATARDLAVVEPIQATARYQLVGPVLPSPATGTAGGSGSSGHMLWSEPNLKITGAARFDPSAKTWTTEAMQIAGDWFAATLKGRVERRADGDEILLEGPARLKMNEVAARLTTLLGMSIQAEGIHETPLLIRVNHSSVQPTEFSVKGDLGWESAEVAGMQLGPAAIPVRVGESTLDIAPTRIPVGQGYLNLAGQIHHHPGPVWVQLDRGVVAESIRLTPEMTNRWLKYLAPLAAETTQIDGTLGAEIDEGVIVFDQPEQSRVTGRLNIGSVELNAGRLADQVLYGVKQLESIGSGLMGQPPVAAPGKTLIRMPAQVVDFTVNQGVVSHERLFFEVDRAQVVTSGRVSFDGRLNMIAMVPLDARWLGKDLQGLAGQTVALPIDGTLSRPSLDSSGVAQVITQLGAQAVQSTAENYLQQQLNRGLEKLFGR